MERTFVSMPLLSYSWHKVSLETTEQALLSTCDGKGRSMDWQSIDEHASHRQRGTVQKARGLRRS